MAIPLYMYDSRTLSHLESEFLRFSFNIEADISYENLAVETHSNGVAYIWPVILRKSEDSVISLTYLKPIERDFSS